MDSDNPTPSVPQPSKRSGFILRWIAGLLLLSGSLASGYFVFNVMSVEYSFQNFNPDQMRETDADKMAEANMFLSGLLRRDPTNGRVRNEYASLLGRRKEYTNAIEEYQKASLVRNAQNGLHFIADMEHKLGNFEAAELRMRDCLIINPTNPEFNNFHLWLLNARMIQFQQWREARDKRFDIEEYNKLAEEFGMAAQNWAIRAPHDVNSYAYLGNFYIKPTLYAQQAYRVMLIALSGNPYMMTLVPRRYIPATHMLNTIKQILDGDYAPRYKGLP